MSASRSLSEKQMEEQTMQTRTQVWRTGCAIVALVLGLGQGVQASTWTFQSVTFADGGTLAGSLTFDASGTLTQALISTSVTKSFIGPGAAYFCPVIVGPPPFATVPCNRDSFVGFVSYSRGDLFAADLRIDAVLDFGLHITFAEDISQSGQASVEIVGGVETETLIMVFPRIIVQRRINVAQQPVVTTPEPSTMVLCLSGVLGLLGYGWRRRYGSAATSAGRSV
jgi:hypothetical protein